LRGYAEEEQDEGISFRAKTKHWAKSTTPSKNAQDARNILPQRRSPCPTKILYSLFPPLLFSCAINPTKKIGALSRVISTDTSLSEEQIIELYGKRWDIEVFFKMCKSYLKLANEFEGRSYDMLTAHTTIVFLRYICLAWHQRQSHDPRCFGELFFLVSDELDDISFAHALDLLLSALVDTLHHNLFLSESQISALLASFFDKLPPFYTNCFLSICES